MSPCARLVLFREMTCTFRVLLELGDLFGFLEGPKTLVRTRLLKQTLRAVITDVLGGCFLRVVFSFRVGTVQNVFHQENSESWQWDLGLA